MKINNIKLTHLAATIILTFSSFGAYATESQNQTLVNKDQVNGRVEEAKGTVKEITGQVINDKSMELEGNIQKNVGKVQSEYGDIKQDIKNETKKDK
ncbi:CsbD family protein [Methylobacter sp. S3L5C]|uniref:CsbD family protein n=1 Tax=Methylobacter sp. S3L5C TaxID=2839024 RepID=UPI001FAD321A|nr:CsbD family protein [Methylobacter sp. S3L5C]UOA07941.1 CsbD family protein [Methylobacter sp. S3L5C]